MRVLVIGASGFLGRATAVELRRRGHEVTGTARSEPGLVRLDVADAAACTAVLRCGVFDAVLNFAASGVTSGSSSRAEMTRVNHTGATALVTSLGALDHVPWYLHTSSSTEPSAGDAAESVYSETKAAGTIATASELRRQGLSHVIARIHNTYGPGQPKGRFIADAVARLRSGQELVLNFPDRIRDFCFVEDVVGHLVDLAEARPTGSNEREIGTGLGLKLKDVAEVIREELRITEATVAEATPSLDDPHPVQVADDAASGFLRCPTTIRQGIRQVLLSAE